MASEDPFITVRDEVKANLEQADLLLESYHRLIKSSAPDSTEVTQTLEDIDQILEDIDVDIVDLQEAVDIISGDPEKYNLSGAEVEKRRGFLANVRSESSRLKSQARPASASNSNNPFTSPEDEPESAAQTEEDRAQEELYQQQILEEQDIQLDSVYQTVGNLRLQANTMGQELGEQAEMLEEFETAVDQSANKLKKGMKRIEIFLKKNEDSKSNCCIAILIIVLIVLLVLVILL